LTARRQRTDFAPGFDAARVQQLGSKQPADDFDPKCAKDPGQTTCIGRRGEAGMFTATLIIAIVLPALMLGHMAHEEIQSQKAYRRARLPARR
jgi:hypothetical protein